MTYSEHELEFTFAKNERQKFAGLLPRKGETAYFGIFTTIYISINILSKRNEL